MIFTENELKKWTLKSQKSQITILLLNQCSISAVLSIVRFAGDQKTALTGESLYIERPYMTLDGTLIMLQKNAFSSKSVTFNSSEGTYYAITLLLWQCYNLCIRRPVPSTDQALPSCFYFRISWILMERRWKTFFWFLRLSAGPQKLDHKVDHNFFTV